MDLVRQSRSGESRRAAGRGLPVEPVARRAEPRRHVLAVVGASGGSGASTLAAACAVRAADRGWTVALVDGGPGGPGADVVLGIEHLPGVRWADLVECRGEVDGPGLLSRLPRADALAVVAHDREAPSTAGADAVRGVLAGLVSALDLVVVDVPRGWAFGRGALESPLQSLADLGSCTAVVVAGCGVLELAALAATAPQVARVVADTHLVLRGHRIGSALVADAESALELPVSGVLEDDPSVGRDVVRGIPPGRSRGPLATVAASLVDLLDGDVGDVWARGLA